MPLRLPRTFGAPRAYVLAAYHYQSARQAREQLHAVVVVLLEANSLAGAACGAANFATVLWVAHHVFQRPKVPHHHANAESAAAEFRSRPAADKGFCAPPHKRPGLAQGQILQLQRSLCFDIRK